LLRLCLEIGDIWRPGDGLAWTRDTMARIRTSREILDRWQPYARSVPVRRRTADKDHHETRVGENLLDEVHAAARQLLVLQLQRSSEPAHCLRTVPTSPSRQNRRSELHPLQGASLRNIS